MWETEVLSLIWAGPQWNGTRVSVSVSVTKGLT